MNVLSKSKWSALGLGFLLVAAVLALSLPRGLRAAGDNVVVNGDFENGANDWTCKLCNLITGSPAQSGAAAQLTTTKPSGRAQLWQNDIALQPNTTYELEFWAQSNGANLQVSLLKQSSPYTDYGLKNETFDVTQSGQVFTVTFTTTGFSQPIDNARLRFRADKGKGKVYSIDNISLTATDSEPPPPPPPPPGEDGNEILVFNRGTSSTPFTVTQNMSGFVEDKPPTGDANANWVSGKFAGFVNGTLYYRARIIAIPENQPGMRLGFCFWEHGYDHEQCRGQVIDGVPGTEMEWSHKLSDMWVKADPIDWANPRTKHGFLVRNQKNKPVSAKKGWNWNGEDPADWYPMEIHYTVVLVKDGGAPDWTKYGW